MASLAMSFSGIKGRGISAPQHIHLVRYERKMKWVTTWRVITYNMIQFICASIHSQRNRRNQPSIKQAMDVFCFTSVPNNTVINTTEFRASPVPTSRHRIDFNLIEDSGYVFVGKRNGEIFNDSHDSASVAGLWSGPGLRHNATSACLLYTT